MRTPLRAVERYYTCLAAQVKLKPIAEDYVDRWMDAVERGGYPPDIAELFEAAGAARVPVLSPAPSTPTSASASGPDASRTRPASSRPSPTPTRKVTS